MLDHFDRVSPPDRRPAKCKTRYKEGKPLAAPLLFIQTTTGFIVFIYPVFQLLAYFEKGKLLGLL